VGLRPAVRISLGRAVRERIRLLISLAYGLIFGFALSLLGRSWAYGFSSAFLFSGFICFCSAIPWRVRLIRKPTFAKILLLNGILASLVGAFCFWISILLPTGILFGIRAVREVLSHFLVVTSSWSLVFPVVGLGIALSEDQEHRERLREAYAKRLEKLAETSRLAALRAQINPHFFFNALNTIAALIPTRPEDAERAVELLAEALRPALSGSQLDRNGEGVGAVSQNDGPASAVFTAIISTTATISAQASSIPCPCATGASSRRESSSPGNTN